MKVGTRTSRLSREAVLGLAKASLTTIASALTPRRLGAQADDVGGAAEHRDLEGGSSSNNDGTAGQAQLGFEAFCMRYGKFLGKGDRTEEQLRATFNTLDTDGSGSVDLREVVCYVLRDALQESSSRVIDLLKSWDDDNSGTIDKEEFRSGIQKLGFPFECDDAAIDTVFDHFDDEKTGSIEFRVLSKQLRLGAGSMLSPLMQPGAVDLGAKGVKHKLRSKDPEAKGSKLVRQATKHIDLTSNLTVVQQLRGMLSANVARVIDLFREWDDDGSGEIDKKEFRQALKAMGVDADTEDVNALFDSFDADGGGTIEFAELNAALRGDTRIDADLDERLKAGAISNQNIRAIQHAPRCGFFSGGGRGSRSGRARSRQGSTKGSTTRDSSSTSGDPSRGSSRGGDHRPQTIKEVVARDSAMSPSWRLYQLNKQVFNIMVTKDRSMPMNPAARSPRHTSDQSKRLVPPARPKPRLVAKKDRKSTTRLAVIKEEKPMTLCERLQSCGNSITRTITGIWDGFLEQDLEVQMVIGFAVITVAVNVYNITIEVVRQSKYVGNAPPAPPTMPDWTVSVSDTAMAVALEYPITYLLVDFGALFIFAALVYYGDDIKQWQKARELKAAGYQTLGTKLRSAAKAATIVKGWADMATPGDDDVESSMSPRSQARALIDPDDGPATTPEPLESTEDLRRALMREIDRVEELDIKLKAHTAASSPMVDALTDRLDLHRERKELLKIALKSRGAELAEKQDAEPAAVEAPPTSEDSLWARIVSSGILKVLNNSFNGGISVYLFFLDVSSDIAVCVLLLDTKNYTWAVMAFFFLIAQYIVVYFRVLPYMRNTFGERSCLTLAYTYLGFPIGVLIFDFLMLLEPFGLLAVLPLPAWLKQFVPACKQRGASLSLPLPSLGGFRPKPAPTRALSFVQLALLLLLRIFMASADKATRVITEIAIEAFPQCVLQSYILVTVMQQSEAGTASPSILAMVGDASTMPKSISISTLAVLKTWMEVVQQSAEAGISVQAKVMQLWHVGAGLPLDALKKGSIVEWACTYELEKAEIPPLTDALIKNTSLIRLNLSDAGLEWDAAKGSAAQLVDEMGKNSSGSALSGLQFLIISPASGFELPMGELRKGPERALAALKSLNFFKPGHGNGPWHTDLMVCGDVLRTNGNRDVTTDREQAVTEEVQSMLEEAQSGQMAREDWEQRLKLLMVGGDLRRSHLQSLLSAEILRDLGFRAADLIGMSFSFGALKNGRFTVSELREAGVAVSDIGATQYTTGELKEGGVVAEELKPLGYEPRAMREGGFTAAEVRAAKYALADLKGVYTAGELYEAEYPAAEMRKVGFEVAELRAAEWRADLLRKGGYTATELKEGGFDATQACAAGYSAKEATAAGWNLKQLKTANFDAVGLRQAQHSATAMRDAGFVPSEMRKANYPVQELVLAGFGAEELRKAGVAISDLMASGVTIADMRDSGIPVSGLKNEGIKLKDMRLGGYTCKEVKGAGYSCKEVKGAGFVKGLKAGGYAISEAVAAKFSCEELHKGGYTAEELFAHGFKPLEMRAVGYDAKSLQDAGVTLPKLRAAGVSVADLRSAGFSCEELKEVGVAAHELAAIKEDPAHLKQAGFELKGFHKLYTVDQLRLCGYSCEELRLVGFGVKEVRQTGATNKELRDGGYSASELRQVGATCKELKVLQYTTADLKECGFIAKELAAVGFDSYSLKMGGYRPRHVKDCGFKGASVFGLDELKSDGFKVPELRDDEGFTLDQLSKCFSVEELRKEGDVKAGELLEVGYALIEMRQGGFSAAELYKAGYGVQDMKKAGFTCQEVREAGFVDGLKEAGFTCKEARNAGFSVELKRAGYSVRDLKLAGCTLSEVRAAGFVRGIKAAGFTCKDAKRERFPARQLRAAGFTCEEAMTAGYVSDLKVAGFTVEEARAANCTCTDLKAAGYVEGVSAAGYTIQECFEAIYSCEQARAAGFVEGFKAAGYTVKEAKVAGFSPEGFRLAGYSCEEFQIAGFSCTQAKLVGYSAKEAKAAGWKLQEIEEAGYVLHSSGSAISSTANSTVSGF